ncbi:phosphatidylserine decarboxylase [Desulfonema ishimotonii]|uniref:Phosphatidylserine decarboxylase n=1 Tax=Desulfonema ishimotonii TaxID=45657 RepID=A0A401G0U4_9BACT|nr:hypothetical protein [Desulfonema ishimotonii]GBC62840.1 phosphatidylserine decarboxylase [Desulfonema ishimotonii]
MEPNSGSDRKICLPAGLPTATSPDAHMRLPGRFICLIPVTAAHLPELFSSGDCVSLSFEIYPGTMPVYKRLPDPGQINP